MQKRVVLITGGSNGIGKETALAFAKTDAHVLITGRHLQKLKETAELHTNIFYVVADSNNLESPEHIVSKALALWGRIDVLINNVGTGLTSPLEHVRAQQIQDVFNVNVVSTSLLTKACLPHLKKHKGAIINISSTLSQKAAPGLSHYGASKAAIDYLTKTWALELAPHIRVNAIAPGPTESGALTGMMGLTNEEAEQVKAKEAQAIPLKRRGLPTDISQWILWLTDPKSNWVTGQIIGIDGGFGI